MTYSRYRHRNYTHEWIFAAVGIGLFLIVVGAIFITTPHLTSRIIDFFNGFRVARVPNTSIDLPAPVHPTTNNADVVVYNAFAQFSLGWAIVQVIILALRLALRSPLHKTAEDLGNAVFWWGTYYLAQTWLVETTVTTTIWFEFWALIIAMIGISLLVRGAFLAAAMPFTRKPQETIYT